MTFHSGQKGAGTINGTEFPLINWSALPAVKTVEFRNSRSGSFARIEPTFQGGTFEFEIDYDFDANPFGSGVGLNVGARLADVRLFLDGIAGDYWDIPSFVVTETPVQLSVEGKLTTKVGGVADGPFGYPGSPVSE